MHANAEHWHDSVHTTIVAHAPAWECRSGRSASSLEYAAQICDAERHEMHVNAEHWHDRVHTITVAHVLRPLPSAYG